MIDPVSVLALGTGAAAAAGVGVFAHLVGYDRDRAFYPTVLTVVGAMYVLFATIAKAGAGLLPELLFLVLFAALAAWGFRTSLWLVVAGLALHGVFDLVRHSAFPGPGAPSWWPAFCGGYDIVAAAALAVLMVARKGVARPEATGAN